MKKLVTIFLAIAMIFAMTIPAFAVDTALTINGSNNRTYVGYKLLDLITGHKTNVDCDDNHDDDCYNYAYTVADKYRTILQNEVFENGGTAAAAAKDITDAQIIDYLSNQSSGDYAGLRVVADRLYTAIKAASIGVDLAEFDGTATIAQGYWMFADTTNLEGEEAANSFVMVDTKGEKSLEITPKTALPTIIKEVYDVNDTTTTNAWADSADHDINDDVQFRLTATLAENFEYYDAYKLIFHDNLADGLTLDTTSIEVTANNAGVAVDIKDKFTVNPAPVEANCDFEVIFNDVTAINGVTKDTVFVVTYTAKLNENAVVGTTGNPNDVTLEFSNDPYSTSTGTSSAKVNVYTYQLTINKFDDATPAAPLKGAGFTLYKKNSEGQYVAIGNEQKGNDMITFTWKGIDDGDYKLVETTVPAGYNKMADKEFTITAGHTKDAITTLTSGIGDVDVAAGLITEDIINRTGAILPETGAMGTIALVGIGTMLVIVAAVFMITRKKMSVYED